MRPVRGTEELTSVGPHGHMVSAFTVPARLQSLAFVRSAITCLLDRDTWGAEETGRVLLAAGEALCNAIEHGSPGDGRVAVQVVIAPPGATLVVTDEGRSGRAPRIDLAAPPPPPSSVRGRGIPIMRALADDIRVEAVGAGTRLTLDFSRPAAVPAAGMRRAA